MLDHKEAYFLKGDRLLIFLRQALCAMQEFLKGEDE
jgi:hypothetical protein